MVMRLRIFYKVISILLYVALMFVTAATVIGYAAGYRYSFSSRKIYQVSVAHLISNPAADIIINGITEEKKTPKPVYLEPGRYNIEIKKSGYYSYFASIELKSGELLEKKDIVLFRSGIRPEATINNNIDNSQFINDSLVNSDNPMIANNHEIWSNSKLVTRFSKNIYRAVYYTNQNYIVYQDDDGIGAIRIDGSNNVKLFDYKYKSPAAINFKNRGQVMVITDGTTVLSATIN